MALQILTPRKFELKLYDLIKSLDQRHLLLSMNQNQYMAVSG